MDEYFKTLQRAIDYIEENIRQPLDMSEIARTAGFSSWHFQRLFKAITKDSVYQYVLARRMTLAAEELLNTKSSIIDISFDFLFETQESFTRAFKKYYGVPPGKYRVSGGSNSKLVRKLKLSEAYIANLTKGEIMNPSLRTLPKRRLVGLSAAFNGALGNESANNHQVIPDLWKRFNRRSGDIAERKDDMTVGVITPDRKISRAPGKDRLAENLIYHACAEIGGNGEIPNGMSELTLEEHLYACFTHKGPISDIDHTINYIVGNWFPSSTYVFAEKVPTLEIFPAGYDPKSPEAQMEFCIPVKSVG